MEVAQGFNLEGVALATRTRADGGGGANIFGGGTNSADLYSLYTGPTFARRIGNLDVGAGYRFGYTKVDIDTQNAVAPGIPRGSSFESSTKHGAVARVGQGLGELQLAWRGARSGKRGAVREE